MPAQRPLTTTDDQSATFIELFFDLVFVFAVTQVVALLHADLTWEGVGRASLVFWFVWWAWTQFTWALNSADTTHPAINATMIGATGIAFLLAVTLPDAFTNAGLQFAALYVVVRLVGLGLYVRVAWEDALKRAAVRKFALMSVGGFVAVLLGGASHGDARAFWWVLAIAFDLLAALRAAPEGWDVRPDHFGERHGLFVIIALGESLIAAGATLTGEERTGQTMAVAVLAVALTCGLWWTYFAWARPVVEAAMQRSSDGDRSKLARDLNVFHFPLVFGIVLFAVAVEEAVAHPAASLPASAQTALAVGVGLYVAGMTATLARVNQSVMMRVVLLAVTLAGLALVGTFAVYWSLAVAAVGVTAIGVFEQVAQPRSDLTSD